MPRGGRRVARTVQAGARAPVCVVLAHRRPCCAKSVLSSMARLQAEDWEHQEEHADDDLSQGVSE